jgi:hypothetical protein
LKLGGRQDGDVADAKTRRGLAPAFVRSAKFEPRVSNLDFHLLSFINHKLFEEKPIS